jgi:hypothetical protein
MFIPFGFIAPIIWQTGKTNSGRNKTKEPKQDRQILGAIKPKDLNRIDKFWEE